MNGFLNIFLNSISNFYSWAVSLLQQCNTEFQMGKKEHQNQFNFLTLEYLERRYRTQRNQ